MKAGQHIKKFLIISLWFVAGVGVMALLVASIRVKRDRICKGYEVEINGAAEGQWFIDKKEVVQLLTNNGNDIIFGKSISQFELKKMETRLESDQWVKDAELFFNNNQVLKVKIIEREPIARVFTTAGSSFYIDSTCQRLALSEKMSARLPVFTGFPSNRVQLKQADKALLKDIKNLSVYIVKHPFWMAQVSQIDITPKKMFEIIPTIGNHVIEFGDGKNCERKFRRLFVFYRQVLSKSGMEKYARINVQYEKQIIAVRNNFLTKTDSLKYLKSIEHLIASSQQRDSTRRDSLATKPPLKSASEFQTGTGNKKDEIRSTKYEVRGTK